MKAMTVGTSAGNKIVQQGWVGTSSGNKLFFVNLAVVISGGGGFTGGPPVWATPAFTATPSGGTAPYAYSWTADDPNAAPANNLSPSTIFLSSTGDGTSVHCLVTDANGSTATGTGST